MTTRFLCCAALYMTSAVVHAIPTVTGNTISWPDDGWYQVQAQDSYREICGGTRSCTVEQGTYIVINHTSGQRFVDIKVTGNATSDSAIVVSDNLISWPNDGWYQVQNEVDYTEVCGGGSSCTVEPGSYLVVNHTTGSRYPNIIVNVDSTMEPIAIEETLPDTDDISVSGQLAEGTLRRLLPYRDTVFGEDIASFPEPSRLTHQRGGDDAPADEGSLAWDYAVVGDQLVNLTFEPPLIHSRMWANYARIVPIEWRVHLKRIMFFVEQDFTGLADALYYPGQEGDEIVQHLEFRESLTQSLGTPETLDSWSRYLIVHETGHVIEMVDADSGSAPIRWCFAHYEDICQFDQTYWGHFYDDFWSDEITENWDAIINAQPDDKYTSRYRDVIYPMFPELFVSQYAATNLTEDFAESFEVFVRTDSIPAFDEYNGAAKVLWFWQQPALVLLRDQLRAALSD